MIKIRPSNERGSINYGWLETKHTFSFGQYHNPLHMGFSHLQVVNEDKIIPTEGFMTHTHRNIEIITYIINGQLEHKDSLRNNSTIAQGEIQRITAGTGINHSEYNPSKTDNVHFLQIWILPDRQGLTPSYEQKYFSPESKQGKLTLIGSSDGRENSILIHQDVKLYASILDQNQMIEYVITPHRNLWLQLIKGSLKVNDQNLVSGDGCGIILEEKIKITALSDQTEFLLFDLAEI